MNEIRPVTREALVEVIGGLEVHDKLELGHMGMPIMDPQAMADMVLATRMPRSAMIYRGGRPIAFFGLSHDGQGVGRVCAFGTPESGRRRTLMGRHALDPGEWRDAVVADGVKMITAVTWAGHKGSLTFLTSKAFRFLLLEEVEIGGQPFLIFARPV